MSPRRPDDPDPIAETPLAPDDRAAMLEKLSEHMRPRIRTLSDDRRNELKCRWDDLRDQDTVESFTTKAEELLAALDAASPPDSAKADEKTIGGFLRPSPSSEAATASAGRGKELPAVLSELPPANWKTDP